MGFTEERCELVRYRCSKTLSFLSSFHPLQLILFLHLFVSSSPLLSVYMEVEVKTLCSQGLFFAGEIKPQFISDPSTMRDGNVQQPTCCIELNGHDCA